jgi:hypothetical protein
MIFSAPARGLYQKIKENTGPVNLGGGISLLGSLLLISYGELKSAGALLLCVFGETAQLASKPHSYLGYSVGYGLHGAGHAVLLMSASTAGDITHQFSLGALVTTYGIAASKHGWDKLADRLKTNYPKTIQRIQYVSDKIPEGVAYAALGLRIPALLSAEGMMIVIHSLWGSSDAICGDLHSKAKRGCMNLIARYRKSPADAPTQG